MITFKTRTVVSMTAVMAALIAGGSPVQLVGRKRKEATTTADRETLRAAAKQAAVRIFIDRSELEHRTAGGVSQAVRS